MNDDFNTPVALSRLFGFAREVNIYLNSPGLKNKLVLEKIYEFYQDFAGQILGILKEVDSEESFEQEIKNLIKEREETRKAKNWKKSDQIRDELRNKGVILEDTPEGVRWKKIK